MTNLDSLLLLRYNPWAFNTSDITLISEYSTFKRRMGFSTLRKKLWASPPPNLPTVSKACHKEKWKTPIHSYRKVYRWKGYITFLNKLTKICLGNASMCILSSENTHIHFSLFHGTSNCNNVLGGESLSNWEQWEIWWKQESKAASWGAEHAQRILYYKQKTWFESGFCCSQVYQNILSISEYQYSTKWL